MSGATVEYSLNLQTALNGDKISAMCIAPSSFGFGYYWNNFYFGTSNGRVYKYNEDSGAITRITITGYTGTLSGSITSLTTDPAGKYLFLSAPSDSQFLRIPLGSTGNIKNIQAFGSNTGGVAINSQNTVYFITANGNAISTVDNYGQGQVNLVFQQPIGSNSIFTGLVLSADETRIYTADSYTGNIYYFDFTSGQNTLQSATAASPVSRISSLAVLTPTDILYTQTKSAFPGVYLYNVVKNTSILIAGGGSNTLSSFAQNYQFINPNQIAVDQQGDLYITSLNPFGSQLFTKVAFNIFVRSPIAAPVPSPHFPNCGLPAPGYCKKSVVPFNPTEYWSFASPQRIAVHRAPAGDGPGQVRYSCINTATILCPTIPTVRVNPNPPPPPTPPIAPVYPVETPTSQSTKSFISTGTMTSLRLSASSISIINCLSQTSYVPMSFGPQGYIYFMTRSGILNVLTTSGGTVFPKLLYQYPQGATVSSPVVVSSTGLVAFITDSKLLKVIDQVGYLRYSTTLNQQIAGAPVFLDTQSLLIAAYGNTILALDTTSWNTAWSNTLEGDQFKSSLVTDGISVFAGTLGGNVVSYSATTGSKYWSYPTGTLPICNAPFMAGNLLATFVSNSIYVINKTPTRFGGGADTVVTLSGIGTLQTSPMLFTDFQGTTWLYFTTTSGILYAAGGFLGVPGVYIDSTGGNVGSFWRSFESNVLSNITPVIDGGGSLYVCASNAVYRYPTPPTSSRPVAFNTAGPNLFQYTTPGLIYTSPIISSQNKLSFVAFDSASGSNYVYTISS
jgi:outer membrane protein assembly factor BamB